MRLCGGHGYLRFPRPCPLAYIEMGLLKLHCRLEGHVPYSRYSWKYGMCARCGAKDVY